MRFGFLLASAVMVAGSGGASAQNASVNDHLCTFAGDCGQQVAAVAAQSVDADGTPTKRAPKTKGFRIAQAETKPAPDTKGFRIAPGAGQETRSAPTQKGFRVANATSRGPAARGPATRRPGYTAPRAAMTAGQATPRANLLLAFDYNSAAMTPAAEAKARVFAQALMMDQLKDKRFMIEGHTDARGLRAVNVDLSRRRAQSVADFLVAQGVDRSRVEVKGVGPDEPLPGHSARSEANRRVEAVLLS